MTERPSTKRSSRRPTWRRWTALAAALVVVPLAVLHTDWAQDRVLRVALRQLSPDGSIAAHRLDYNLLALRLRLGGLEIRSPGDPRPYFTADEVHLDAPWSALWTPSLQHLILVQPRFHVVVDSDGSGNFTGGGDRVEMALPIDRLELQGLSVRWEDERFDASLRAERLDLQIAEKAGESWLRQPQPAQVRRGEATEELRLTDGTIGWDGLAGLLRELQLDSAPLSLRADGRIDEVLAERALSLDAQASLSLDALESLLPEIGKLEGTVNLDTTIGGTAADPELDVSVVAPRLYAADLGLDDVEADLRWDGTLLVERFRGRLAGGELAAEGVIGLGRSSSELRAQWSEVSLAPLIEAFTEEGTPRPLATTTTGELTLEWPEFAPDAASVTAVLDAELRRQGADGLAGSVSARVRGSELDATLDVSAPDRHASIRADITGTALDEAPWLAAIEADVDVRADLSRLPEVTADAQISAGTARLLGHLAGDLETLRLVADVQLEQLQYSGAAGIEPLDARAEVTVDTATWSITGLAASAGDLSVSGDLNGRIAPPSFRGTLNATSEEAGAHLDLQIAGSADLAVLEGRALLDLTDLNHLAQAVPQELVETEIPNIAGQAVAEVQFTGGLHSLVLAGSITADRLTVAGSKPLTLRSSFEAAAAGTRITEFTLRGPGAEVSVSGVVGPAARTVDLVADLVIDEMAQISGLQWLDPIHQLRTTVEITHDRELNASTVELSDLWVDLSQRTVRTMRPARIVWDSAGLVVEDVLIAAGGTTLEVAGSLPTSGARDAIVTRLTGNLGDLSDLIELGWQRATGSDQPTPDTRGDFDLQLTIDGKLDDFAPSGSATLRGGSIGWGTFEPVEDIDVALHISAAEVRLESLGATWRGAAMRGTGSVPLAYLPGVDAYVAPADDTSAGIELQLLSLSTTMLSAFLPESFARDIGGEANATIEITATRPEVASLSGEIRLDHLRLWRRDLEITQRRPTRLQLEGTRVTVADLEWVSNGSGAPSVRVSGSADINPIRPYDSMLELHGEASAEMAWLDGIVPGVALGGSVRIDMGLLGTVAAPQMHGRIELVDVNAAVREPRLRVSGLTGTLRLDGTSIETDGIAGFANGGEVMLFVNLDLADPFLPTGTAGINGRGLAVQAAGLRVDTDLSLTLATRGAEGATLLGSITVNGGGYRSNQSILAGVEAQQYQRSAGLLLGTSSAAPAAGTIAGASTFLDRLSYDIRIESAGDLVLATRETNLSAALDLQLVGAGARPGLLGEVRINEGGEVRLGGNTLIVDRGSVDFADANRIAPTLDIAATSRVRSYDVMVTLSGNAFSPTLEATTSDGHSQSDALSLLTVGRTLEEAGGAGTEILAEQAFNVVAGRMGGLGIASSVRFEQAQDAYSSRSLAEPDLFPRTTDLAARLSFTRSFGESFDLIYSQGLTQTTDQSWIGVWRLPWNLQLQGGTFDGASRSAEILHGFQVGRAANDQRSREARTTTSVTDVLFAGAPDRSASELLDRLGLSPGKRFDFIKWRRDVERLEGLYRQAGYYAVQVKASRSPAGSADPDSGVESGVLLTYEITPGPLTILAVEGHSFDNDTVASMQRIWQESVADAFLLQDLALEAVHALVEQGYVTATATAAFDLDTEDERRIRVRARPGPRFGTVSLEIEGADTVGARRVRDRLAAVDMERGTWWDPATTAQTIRALYRSEGFPEVDVEIADARFASGTATARIIVREGAPRRLQGMTFTGNTTISSEKLRQAVPLADGARITPASITAALTAVESAYLDLAHNNVTIAAEQRPLEDGIEVVFQIREGPRRVLREIEIIGRQRTRPSVLERAIKMRPGDAVVLAEVQKIRRRLMDTGALRSASVRSEDLGTASEGEAPAKLVVTIVEKAMFEISYGVQVLSDTLNDQRRTRPGFSAIAAHQNFLGIGARVSAMGRYRSGEPFGRVAMGFTSFLGLPIQTTLLAQKGREEIGAQGARTIRRDETRLLGEQRVRFGRLTVGYSYSWERNQNRILELPADSPYQLPAVNIARLVPTLIWDGRDDAFAPRSGLFHSSTMEIAPEALGSELGFWKYSGQQFFFVPAGPIVLATAVRVGAGESKDANSIILPRGELFTVGGATTVRGYPTDSLGRTEFFGSYFAGGNAMLILNQEARFPIWRWFRGVAFVDAGSAFAEASEIKLSSLAYSAGAGLRLVTPAITLRLDYGFRLTDIEYLDSATGGLHFGIGHIF